MWAKRCSVVTNDLQLTPTGGPTMILLRHELGEVLRERRQEQGRTLRDVAGAGAVSLGYLSEVERGVKEASSELLAAICDSLDIPMSVVLDDVSRRVARVESLSAPVSLPVADRSTVVSASAA
jgi:transcriptional regulator with XRE-family HTH domain